jgi:hypothetical protein
MEWHPMTDMTAEDSVTVDAPQPATKGSAGLDAVDEQLIDRLASRSGAARRAGDRRDRPDARSDDHHPAPLVPGQR